MKLNRTKNGIRNMIWGILNKMINTIVPFAIRTVFIYFLGSEYLGLNSLFTSILTVLNLAELGFSNAIVFNMYKPIADNDTNTICALMNYYKKVYHLIGIIVSLTGIIVIPFLPRLIEGEIPEDINLTLLYILYLFNTAVSYFLFAYKNCILTAYQREDIISRINIVLKTIMYFGQFFVLVVLKNYYAYLACLILNTIFTNIITAYYSNKYYPQYRCNGNIERGKIKEIRKNIEGLMVGKLCLVSRNAFDNIFLSFFLGLNTVTIYGNYYYIMNAISGILTIIMSSIGAGIGNSIATETREKNHKDYLKFIFMYSWISGWCSICLFCLYQPFMKIWMGEKMLFPLLDVILLCLYFYSLTMGDVRSQYSAAAGLFWQNRIYVLVEAVVNILLNFFLGKYFGVHGIILATWISIFFINFGWGSLIIYKYYFIGFKARKYYFAQLKYLMVTILTAAVTFGICSIIELKALPTFFCRMAICIVIPNFVYVLVYRKESEYKESIGFIKHHSNDLLKRGRERK